MGGGGTRETIHTQPSVPVATIPSQFAPYATQVGQRATQFTEDPRVNLQQFLGMSPIPFSVPPLDPLTQLAYGQVGQRSLFGIPTPPAEQQLQQYATGPLGSSQAVQSAVQNFKSVVDPVIQNSYARMGLSQAPTLAEAEGRALAGALTPIYQQGLAQQMAANQYLAGRQEQRPIEALKEAQTFGELQRAAQQQQAAANVAEFQRVQNLVTSYVNPFGSFNVLSSPGPSQTTQTMTPTGWGFGK